MRISYQGTVGWSSPTVMPEMANAYDYATFFNQACTNANVIKQYNPEKLQQLQQYMKDPASVNPWAELNGENNLVGAFENTPRVWAMWITLIYIIRTPHSNKTII